MKNNEMGLDDKIIDGKRISQEIRDELKEKISREKLAVSLAVILVGDNPASKVYVRNKQKACEYVGIRSVTYELPENTSETELLELVAKLNDDDDCDGILVQLPLPSRINEDKIISSINYRKDVDGFHPINVGKLSIGQNGFVSCTPAGIIELLKRSNIALDGKRAVIVGRSNIVGKPMALLLLRENATVTVAHSHTKNLPELCREADVLIVAIGQAKMIKRNYIKDQAVVIDVGMNRDEDGKLCGDVDYDDVLDVISAITPVPGGVGPMTIAMLLKNCVESHTF